MRYVLITNLGLYDRDHSEKEYWVWELDGSEANFTSWRLKSFGPANGCVFTSFPAWDLNGNEMEPYWCNDNCYAKNVALCQKKVADYDFLGSPLFPGCVI